MLRKKLASSFLLFFLLLPALALSGPAKTSQPYQGKKILWVDSYHEGYAWTAGIERGIRQSLQGSGVELRIERMNTKWIVEEGCRKQAALKAKSVIKEFRPDVVIASDDNAAKYLVVPYLKNTTTPVVFCGINWDASPYGFPCRNVTGMVEVEPVMALVRHLRRYAKGSRLGYLSADTATERKLVGVYNKYFFNGQMKSYLAKNFTEFKELFLQAQQEVDMVYIANHSDMPGWDPVLAEEFLAQNVALPTGSRLAYMERFVAFTVAKVPEEQGEWAASTALRILDGTKPGNIPLAANEKASLTLNLKMAEAAGIQLPVEALTAANKVIGQEALR